MTFALEATLGIMHLYAAHTAVATLTDIRAQRWLAEKMPSEMDRIGRSVFFPSPFELWFDTGFKGEPAWRDHPVIVEGRARRDAHERTASVGYARGENVVGYETFGVPHDAHAIIDWLGALGEEDPRLLDKLPRVTWQQAKEHAKLWHERLANRRGDGIAGDLGTVDRLDIECMPGWRWVHLVTRTAFDREGVAMGHCIGGGGYDRHAWPASGRPDVWNVDEGIWSLRDPDGRSRVTVEIYFDGIAQAQGPENACPEDETIPAFKALLDRFVKPGYPFRVPRWLDLAEDGTTTRRRPVETAATFRPNRMQRIILDEVDQAVWGAMVTPGDVERARMLSLGREAVVTSIDTAVRLTVRSASDFIGALARMCGEPDAGLTFAEWIRRHALVGGIDPDPEPPASAFIPPGRRDRRRPEPWYRTHERQQVWRTPR